VKGFGVHVQRGGSKSYILHYRGGIGRGATLHKLTIGRHGSPWTAETAHAEMKRLLGMVEGGADPAADGIARKEAPTIADLAERFLAEHVEAKRKASTALGYRRLLDRVILPALAMDAIRHDIAKLHHGLRETPYQANRLLAVLSKMFNLAERWGLRPDGSNPCRHVEKFGERKRERMLSPDELARLGDALAACDGSPYAVAAVKLSVFAGAKALHPPPPALAVPRKAVARDPQADRA
jgi:Arm DNA-binding domain